jgi:hypothetical protein
MIGFLCFALAALTSPFKSKLRLEAENAVLRHQLIVLRRGLHSRVRLTNHDRWFFIQLYRWFPSLLKVQGVDTCKPFAYSAPLAPARTTASAPRAGLLGAFWRPGWAHRHRAAWRTAARAGESQSVTRAVTQAQNRLVIFPLILLVAGERYRLSPRIVSGAPLNQ